MSTPDLLSSLNRNGSGLNLRELAQTLARAETAPRMSALQNRVEADTLKLSALDEIKGKFQGLAGIMAEVASNPILTVETSTASVMPRVIDRSKLQTGATPIEVTSLATRQVLEFTGFQSPSSTLTAGTLTVEFGQWDATTSSSFTASGRGPVALDISEGMTLQDLATRLNRIEGISARVLDKGDGTFSLGVVGELGASSGLRLTASGSGTTGDINLADIDTNTTNAARQVQAAGDARLVVDGIAISRPSNTLRDVLPGMELTLQGTVFASLNVVRDEAAARSNVSRLIDGLNETVNAIRTMTSRGIGEGTAGILPGDQTLERLEQSLRKLVATPLVGHGETAISLADMGVATQRSGLFRFDPPAFDRTFRSRAADFDALLGDSLRSNTEGLRVAGLPGKDLASGEMQFRVGPNGASLNGFNMLGLDLGDGRRSYIGTTGPVQGLSLTAEAGVTSGSISFGRSFLGSLALLIDDAVGSSGALGRRSTEIGRASTENQQRVEALEARASILEKRYLSNFAGMEQAITRMKTSGAYIQNMVDLWSKKD
jgi:flagellar hook-associated protein 2